MWFVKTILFCSTAYCALAALDPNATNAFGETDTVSDRPLVTNSMSPEDRLIYLQIVKLLADSSTPEFRSQLRRAGERALGKVDTFADTDEMEDALMDPLMMQADPASILYRFGAIMELSLQNRTQIDQEISVLKSRYAFLNEPSIDLRVMEMSTSFRFALMQAAYATSTEAVEIADSSELQAYTNATYQLRSTMELLKFEVEIDILTAAAIDNHAGAVAALNREILADFDPYTFQRATSRAARMNSETREELDAELNTLWASMMPMFMNQNQTTPTY